jgi:hypothetical protein
MLYLSPRMQLERFTNTLRPVSVLQATKKRMLWALAPCQSCSAASYRSMLTQRRYLLFLAAVLLLQVVQINANVAASAAVAPLHRREGDRASSKQWTFDTDENEEYSASSVQETQSSSSQLHKEGKEVFHKLFKVR